MTSHPAPISATHALRKPCPSEPQPNRQVAWSLLMPNIKMREERASLGILSGIRTRLVSPSPGQRAWSEEARPRTRDLVCLAGRVGLGAEVRGGRALREVAAQDGCDEGAEDNLGTTTRS